MKNVFGIMVLIVLLGLSTFAFAIENPANNPSIMPVQGKFITRYGYMEKSLNHQNEKMHSGLDIEPSPGANVVATAEGIVSLASNLKNKEKVVFVNHGNGLETRYENLGKIKVSKGQKVSRGQTIADLANRKKTFVHYEVRIKNVPVDPANYILDK